MRATKLGYLVLAVLFEALLARRRVCQGERASYQCRVVGLAVLGQVPS